MHIKSNGSFPHLLDIGQFGCGFQLLVASSGGSGAYKYLYVYIANVRYRIPFGRIHNKRFYGS